MFTKLGYRGCGARPTATMCDPFGIGTHMYRSLGTVGALRDPRLPYVIPYVMGALPNVIP